MDFEKFKIGYVPYLPDLSQPADRRRFPFFAKQHQIKFEIAQFDRAYDIILLTATANLSKWLLYKKNHPDTKFIFEMVDSLILPSDTFSNLFKGVGRFVIGKESILNLDFRKILIQWLKTADVVICSSTNIKHLIEKWNNNVIISLDYMQNEIKKIKSDYEINGKMKLVWEGQSVVLRHLLEFKEVFKLVNSFCELHIITDEKYPSYGNLRSREVNHILSQLPIKTIFHKWEMYKNYEELILCDCGIIPLNKENKMAWHKPANKLISFWFAGLPSLTSATPAYIELMKDAAADFYCTDTDDWVSKIQKLDSMTGDERKMIAVKNLNYVRSNFSNEALDGVWFSVFEKIDHFKS
ncbi:MAG: hypothetical protein ABI267_10860 [Ginsengibacter sp.]